MKSSLILALALSFAAANVQAKELHCDINTAYEVTTKGKAWIFTRSMLARSENAPHHVAIGGGRIWLDGKEQTLSADDSRRVRQIELELHDLTPQVVELATEATDIAFTALIEVSRGFGGDTVKLESAQSEFHQKIKDRPPVFLTSSEAESLFEPMIEPILEEFIPAIVSDVVGSAVTAALTGDEEKMSGFEKRMEAMGEEIERKVGARGEALGAKAQQICTRLARVDALESDLEIRFQGEYPLNLIEMTHSKHHD